MHVIGLTGGIGTGKSEVAAALADLGAAVIDADKEGHAVYQQGSIGWGRIVALFGADMLDKDGHVNRRALGDLVFENPQALAMLNSAVHPLIRDRIKNRLADLKDNGTRVAVIDAAVLYEAGWDDMADEVWAVTAPASVVIPRLEARGINNWDARRRIHVQEGIEETARQADVIIENTGSVEDLRAKVEQLWNDRISVKRQ